MASIIDKAPAPVRSALDGLARASARLPRHTLAWGSIALGLVLLLSINLFANGTLRNAKADLTQQRLYTMSDGTRQMLRAIDEPVSIRLYYSKKLGEAVLERFPVYNHNPYENCTYLGETSRGTPVAVNTEVMGCDLRIGIGCILPHPLTGFGGGGKIVLPGVAAIETIAAHHANLIAEAFARGEDVGTGLGVFEGNPLRLDVAEAAAMAGLDMKIDTVVNGRGETAGLFVGEPAIAHDEGVKMAREAYATTPAESPDVVVLNTYCKASEVVLAVPVLPQLLRDSRADVVLIASAPEGQVTHYLARSFGSRIGGRLWLPRTSLPPNVNRLIVLTRYPDVSGADWLAPPESVVWAKSWPEVRERLREWHGDSASVAVVPDATMQYFPA